MEIQNQDNRCLHQPPARVFSKHKSSKSKTKDFLGGKISRYLDQLRQLGVLKKDIMKVFYLEDVCQSIETVFSIENAFVFLTFFVATKKWTGVILVNSHW